jgi:hypothetical protein
LNDLDHAYQNAAAKLHLNDQHFDGADRGFQTQESQQGAPGG